MTKRVVDVLEPVEIERRDGQWTGKIACAFLQYRVDILIQAHTVGKTRQLVEMSQLPELFLGRLPFGHVPPEKEMLLLRLRPHARPRQGNYSPAFVNIPRFKVTHMLAPAGQLHFATGSFEILRIDEFRATMSDHFIGPVADGC